MKSGWRVSRELRAIQPQDCHLCRCLRSGVHFSRECLAIEVDTSLPAPRLVRVMEQLKGDRGLPKQIRVDNGPELVSSTFADWCEEYDIQLVYIQPGKPQQNGFAERFNGSFRREFLNAY